MASLQELPDDELDKLFRVSAEEFDPPYNPDDWNKLRQKMDDDDRTLFVDRLIYWGLPMLLALVIGATFLIWHKDNDKVSIRDMAQRPASVVSQSSRRSVVKPGEMALEVTERSIPSAPGQLEMSAVPEKGITSRTTKNKPLAEPVSNTNTHNVIQKARFTGGRSGSSSIVERPSPDKVQVGQAKSSLASDVKSEPLADLKATPSVSDHVGSKTKRLRQTINRVETHKLGSIGLSGEREVRMDQARTRNTDNRDAHYQLPSPLNDRVPGSSDVMSTESTHTERIYSLLREGISSENDRVQLVPAPTYLVAGSFIRPDSLVMPTPYFESSVPPVRSDNKLLKRHIPEKSNFFVRLVGVPDWNYVGATIAGQSARSFGYGLLGEFRFLKRLTLQSGGIQSIKRYKAPISEYNVPALPQKQQPTAVNATCTILDVPVNLRFDVLINNRQRWFISAGSSSYVMRKEQYDYLYQYPDDPSINNRGWSSKGKPINFDLFSHLNFSVGYERIVGQYGLAKRLAWQVEPFLKMPRINKQGSGVGHGQIRLISTGIFLSVRYRL